jgi:hypothetical protein
MKDNDDPDERWGYQKEDHHLLAALNSSQKKENETMEEFNKIFNDLVKSLPQTIKPPDASILIHYMEAFAGEIRYQLRDKEPTSLRDAQKYAIKIYMNMKDVRKSNLPGFSRGISYKTNEEKKKKVENQESFIDGIKELTQLIKQMEINHANQMAPMHNRLITMEGLKIIAIIINQMISGQRDLHLKSKGPQIRWNLLTCLTIKLFHIVDLVGNFMKNQLAKFFCKFVMKENPLDQKMSKLICVVRNIMWA